MSDELKASRKARKSALTREINTTERFMAEDDFDEVKKRLENIKLKFREFEHTHEQYHKDLTSEEDIDNSDEYFDEVQNNYIKALKDVKKWFQETKTPGNVDSKPSEAVSRAELHGLMNLPKIELEPFDGDPLKFHSFTAAFNEHVDHVTDDPRIKLTRLLQSTIGRARDAIRYCSLIGGEKGYLEAREILRRRYGNDHLISERIIQNLKTGKPIRNSEDLQELADELSTCHATLSSLNRLNEVDTQSSILDISKRLERYMQNRWKRNALDHKRQYQTYPTFTDFAAFILKEAEEATDPVYGDKSGLKSCSQENHSKPLKSSSFASSTSVYQRDDPPCVLCKQRHRLFYCEQFKSMKPRDRYSLVQSRKLCHNCLLSNHATQNCRKPSVCSVPGCGEKHTKFIHLSPEDQPKQELDNKNVSDVSVNKVEAVNSNTSVSVDVHVPVVKVVVNDKLNVSALLDSASTNVKRTG